MIEAQPRRHQAFDTCAAAADSFLDNAAVRDQSLRAFTRIDPVRLREDAAVLDAMPAAERGPLHGVLMAVKEVYDVAGYECAWGTQIHAGRVPTTDAAAVAKLRAAGALVAGITVSTEYALSRTGPTVNPWDETRTPGASSQGSAAAVGAGLVSLALGSQTIGSVIRPAAYCGCVGMKPTWNAIDVHGSMPLSGPIDHVGLMAADVSLATTALQVLAPDMRRSGGPAQIVCLQPWFDEGCDPLIWAAVENASVRFRQAGFGVSEGTVPAWIADHEKVALDTLLAIDMARNHGADYDRAKDDMTDRLRDYIERGRAMSDDDYQRAMSARAEMATAWDALLGESVAMMPATTGIAPLIEDGTGSRAPQRVWSLLGCPAVSVPVGFVDGLPVGVQLVGGRGRDHAVLAAARHLETR